ncbi:MAG TPA: 5-oxoprolinase subunit PxpA, partial [Candidatus Baltobacteraceae bacterium]|nr:5-oxoprolinase subunit PxpA [Candidatus Baltobacteraceae bacterium]
MHVDLNADLGEGCGNDETLLDVVTSANVACGGHAGDAATMEATVRAALARGVAIGAHPSYPDREHFGRRELVRTAHEIVADVTAQLVALAQVAGRCGARLTHVKAHGALYNRAARDPVVADAVSRAVATFDPHLMLVGLAGGAQIASARAHGLRAVEEVFADRGYTADGTLIPRGMPGATIDDPESAAAAALSFVKRGVGETICIHGDGPRAVTLAHAIRRALADNGVEIRCVDSP